MTVFGSLAEAGLNHWPDMLPNSPMAPGLGDSSGNMFRRERDLGPRRTSVPAAEIYSKLIEQARRVALAARQRAEDSPDSSTALLRWAQAELAAGDSMEAVRVAIRALELLSPGADSSFDAVAAVRIMAAGGENREAELRLKGWPDSQEVLLERASLMLGERRYSEVIELLTRIDSPRAAYLRGFARLHGLDYAGSLREMRTARRGGIHDADVMMVTAHAFWRLGSVKKAISAARQATLLSPGRRDCSLMLIELLLFTGSYAAAGHEIKQLKQRKVLENSDFLLMQARLSLLEGRNFAGSALLKRAAALALEEGDEQAAVEIESYEVVLQWQLGKVDEATLVKQLRKRSVRFSSSVPINSMLADFCPTPSTADLIRRNYEEIKSSGVARADYIALESRLAYLECDFERAEKVASEWYELCPTDPQAAAVSIMMHGQVTENWNAAAVRATEAIRRLPLDETLINNAAYAMALGGDLRTAARLIGDPKWDGRFVIEATRGLVQLSAGNIDQGMALYRRAAELADVTVDSDENRLLMTLHQALTVHRLNLSASIAATRLKAMSLPTIALPADWETKPSLRLIHFVAQRHGWMWPLAVD